MQKNLIDLLYNYFSYAQFLVQQMRNKNCKRPCSYARGLVFKIFYLFIINCFLFNVSSYALTTDTQRAVDEQKILQQRDKIAEEKRRLLQQQEEIEKIRQSKTFQPEIKKESKEIAEEKIFVKEIHVEGVTVFSPKKIQSIISEYTNKELSKIDISNLHVKLQNLYMKKGYIIARIYMDFKDLPNGILKFIILEGVIDKICFQDPKESAVPLWMAFPFLEHNVFNIRDIEQGLEQMNKLLSNDVTMNIKPAEKEGESIVEIMNKKGRRNTLNFGIDNSGSKATSEYRGSSGFQMDNLFRLNDSLNFNYTQGLSDSKAKGFYSKSYSGYMSVPFGYWTINGSYSQSLYLSTIQGLYQTVRSRGDSTNQSLGLDRMISRGQRYRFSSGANINLKNTNSFMKYGSMNYEKLDVGSKKLVPLEIYLSHTVYLANGSLLVKANYVKGLDAFGAKKDPVSMQKGDPKAQYQTWGMSGYIFERFNLPRTTFPLTYMMNFRGQYSGDDLFGSEQFGPSVRGFKDGGVSGETGFSISDDIKIQCINILPFFDNKLLNEILKSCSIGTFYDVGIAYPATYGKNETMSSWGITCSGNFSKYISANISLANAIDVPENIKTEKNEISLSVNANIPLF
jgi:hemolysin activation/secretion protein